MKLRKAANEQVEGMAKPCLTLAAQLRNQTETILEMHDAVGAMVVQGSNGNFVVHNIGTGIALNVTYYFRSLDSPQEAENPRYLFYVLRDQRIELPEPMNLAQYSGNCEIVFSFRSIGGRSYQSTVTMNNHVLTQFSLRDAKG